MELAAFLSLLQGQMKEFASENYLLTVSGVSVFGLLLFELFCKHNLLGAGYIFLQETLINYWGSIALL